MHRAVLPKKHCFSLRDIKSFCLVAFFFLPLRWFKILITSNPAVKSSTLQRENPLTSTELLTWMVTAWFSLKAAEAFKPFRSALVLRLLLKFQPFQTRRNPGVTTAGARGRQQSCHRLTPRGAWSMAVQVLYIGWGFLYTPQRALLQGKKSGKPSPAPWPFCRHP